MKKSISGVSNYCYCRRRWFLRDCESENGDNVFTIAGTLFHEQAHNGLLREKRKDKIILRNLYIQSDRYELFGTCDVVEFLMQETATNSTCILYGEEGSWLPVPIEYKSGSNKHSEVDAIQLLAQAICLEEMLECNIEYGYIFYGKHRQRTKILFTNELRTKLANIIKQMDKLLSCSNIPNGRYDEKCVNCAFYDKYCSVIMKSKYNTISDYISKQIKDSLE